MIQLHPWQISQKDAVLKALRDHRFCCDSSTTGAGKSYISLSVAEALGGPLLVICPKAARTQWRRIAETAEVDLLGITNPENIVRSRKNPWYDNQQKLWHLPKGTTVVFDEVHRGASGQNSLTTEAVAKLKAYPSIRLLCLSATLAETPLKMRATGYWMGLHGYHQAAFYEFCQRYGCRWQDVPGIENQMIRQHGGRPQQRLIFTANAEEARLHMTRLRQDSHGTIVGLRAEDIPDFPEQLLEVEVIDLAETDRKALERAYEEMSDRLKTEARSELAQLLRERERIEFLKAEALAGMAAHLVEDGCSVPVFLNFTSARLRITAALKTLGIHSEAIYGGQRDDDRQAAIDAFQANSCHCIVVMAQAGGAAISLHDLRHERPRVSVISPSYSASEFLQCLGRTRRVGGTKAVYRIPVVAGTLEERIAKKLERKLNNLGALLDSDLNPFTSGD